jgi:hypothetical protein
VLRRVSCPLPSPKPLNRSQPDRQDDGGTYAVYGVDIGPRSARAFLYQERGLVVAPANWPWFGAGYSKSQVPDSTGDPVRFHPRARCFDGACRALLRVCANFQFLPQAARRNGYERWMGRTSLERARLHGREREINTKGMCQADEWV